MIDYVLGAPLASLISNPMGGTSVQKAKVYSGTGLILKGGCKFSNKYRQHILRFTRIFKTAKRYSGKWKTEEKSVNQYNIVS